MQLIDHTKGFEDEPHMHFTLVCDGTPQRRLSFWIGQFYELMDHCPREGTKPIGLAFFDVTCTGWHDSIPDWPIDDLDEALRGLRLTPPEPLSELATIIRTQLIDMLAEAASDGCDVLVENW